MIFYIIMEFFVNAVKFVAGAVCFIIKVHFAFAMAINAPPHAQFRELVNFWHFLDIVWVGVFTFVYLVGLV